MNYIFDDERYYPRTWLSSVLHIFGLVVGLWGVFSHATELILIGGFCCILIDLIRSAQNLFYGKSISKRLYVYVIGVSILWSFYGFLLAFAYSGIISASLIYLVGYFPLPKGYRSSIPVKQSDRTILGGKKE